MLVEVVSDMEHASTLGVSMSSDDDTVRRILQSGKEESDRRSALGLPLDGNFDRHQSGRAPYDGGGGGGSFLVAALGLFAYLTFNAAKVVLWLMWQIVKAFCSAFSRRR